uniref:SYO1-like TPR repeats domain-containing protein n=1 Tax=Glossina pallidipes TaxID=7398 RepID=A0A1B0AH86_GLOPL
MGKTRKHKIQYSRKSNPLFAINGNDIEDFLNNSSEIAIGPIEAVRDQLQNANTEEKLNGLQSLAVLTASKDKVAGICQTDIVRIVGPFLCEKDESVRNAAAGALRNLSVASSEVCDYLVEQDILTPLFAMLQEYAVDDWKPKFDVNMCNQMDIRSDIFLQAINLLWNLCESAPYAVDTFNQTVLMESFIRCLDFSVYGLDIAISVAQFFLVVSENNPKSWKVLNDHVPNFLCLLSLTGDYGQAYLCSLAAAILTNVPALAASYNVTMLRALAGVLKINHQIVISSVIANISNLSNLISQPETLELEIKMDTTDDESEEAAANRRRRQELPTEADIAVRDIGYLLDAQRVAAEVITNLCSDEDDYHDEDGNDIDDESISENECVVDYESNKSSESSLNLLEGDKFTFDVIDVIKSLSMVEQLWQRAQPLSDDLSNQLRETDINLLMKAKNLRISSLLCLQNLCNCLTAEDLGGHNAIYSVWLELGQQVFKGPRDYSIMEPSTSLMRSALEHLKSQRELFKQMAQNDLELILGGVKNCSMPEIRANWLRMLGTLGCLLAEPLVKLIISFIVETCTHEEDVWTLSEAFDALMDMFSDNDWPEIIMQMDLVKEIRKLEKIFRSKARSQRKELKERYPAVQTVRTNLTRFVMYLEKESIKLGGPPSSTTD